MKPLLFALAVLGLSGCKKEDVPVITQKQFDALYAVTLQSQETARECIETLKELTPSRGKGKGQ